MIRFGVEVISSGFNAKKNKQQQMNTDRNQKGLGSLRLKLDSFIFVKKHL